MQSPERLRRNLYLLCAFKAGYMSLFPIAILTLFWKQRIGMDMQQIMLIQGMFGLMLALCEFPSGYLADRVGYRRTLIISSIIGGVGWAFYLVANDITTVLLAELTIGVSMSLISGTDSAVLYESLMQLGEEDSYGKWSGRVRFYGQMGEGTAALFAGVLYVWKPLAPFVLEVGIWVVNVAIVWQLTEPVRSRPPYAGHWRQIVTISRQLFGNPRLVPVICLSIALGMASFVPVWIIPLYAVDAGLATAWIGPMWAVANYAVAVSALFSHRLEKRFGTMPALLLCVLLVIIGYAGLGYCHAWWGFVFYYLLTIMRGFNGPILNHQEQRLIQSENRAGMLSMHSMVFRFLFLVLGPVVGAAIDNHGAHPVFWITGAVLASCASAAWLGLAWSRRRYGPAAAPAGNG